jgi:hypothetical protein
MHIPRDPQYLIPYTFTWGEGPRLTSQVVEVSIAQLDPGKLVADQAQERLTDQGSLAGCWIFEAHAGTRGQFFLKLA